MVNSLLLLPFSAPTFLSIHGTSYRIKSTGRGTKLQPRLVHTHRSKPSFLEPRTVNLSRARDVIHASPTHQPTFSAYQWSS